MGPDRGPDMLEPDEFDRRRWERMAFEFPAMIDFDNPDFERRRLVAECFGTFLLVLAGAGADVVDQVTGGGIGRTAAVTAPGLTVLVIVLFMGAVSGAHLNPVVSLAFALRGDFPWRRTGRYVATQLVGATLACLVLRAIFGPVGRLGTASPGADFTDRQALAIEIVLTVGLVSTILGTASTAQNVGHLSAFGVGGYVVLAGLWASPVSGAVMNPASAVGPALASGDFAHLWLYIVGPVVGSIIAVGIAWLLRGPGGDPKGKEAAQGSMNRAAEAETSQHAPGTDNERLSESHSVVLDER